jgi:Lon protease-like protein
MTDSDRATLKTLRQKLEALVTSPGTNTGIPPEISDAEVVDTLAQYAPINAADRQSLLELDSVVTRAQTLLDLLAPPQQRR